jgi:hypothetical protein
MTADFSSWPDSNYSNSITIDYGLVWNLDTTNISYPILITIVADPEVNQNMFVQCTLSLGNESESVGFSITPAGANVRAFKNKQL